MVDEIEADLQQQAVREVSSESIGERVLSRLQQVSEVAYVRFASVYRQFQGIRDFTETLSQLKDQGIHNKRLTSSTICDPSPPPFPHSRSRHPSRWRRAMGFATQCLKINA